MDVEYDNPFILQSVEIDRDDIDQEMALLRLMGLKPNRRIVTAKLSLNAEALFQGDPGNIASTIVNRSLPPVEVVQRLIEWSIDQSDDIGKLILDFLAEPDDDRLDEVIDQLKSTGIIRGKVVSSGRGLLSETLTIYLSERPRSKDELYEYARVIHSAKRPEAAVRQYLRRALKQGQLRLSSEQKYEVI